MKQILLLVSFFMATTSFGINTQEIKLRVARPTNDLTQILSFYRDGLGLEVIGEFHDHQEFDGIMLGKKGSPYHFEFTHQKNHKVPNAPSKDNLIVFYLPEKVEFNRAVERMKGKGFKPVTSYNPYWDRGGMTFEDHEGYRVVLYNGEWKE